MGLWYVSFVSEELFWLASRRRRRGCSRLSWAEPSVPGAGCSPAWLVLALRSETFSVGDSDLWQVFCTWALAGTASFG